MKKTYIAITIASLLTATAPAFAEEETGNSVTDEVIVIEPTAEVDPYASETVPYMDDRRLRRPGVLMKEIDADTAELPVYVTDKTFIRGGRLIEDLIERDALAVVSVDGEVSYFYDGALTAPVEVGVTEYIAMHKNNADRGEFIAANFSIKAPETLGELASMLKPVIITESEVEFYEGLLSPGAVYTLPRHDKPNFILLGDVYLASGGFGVGDMKAQLVRVSGITGLGIGSTTIERGAHLMDTESVATIYTDWRSGEDEPTVTLAKKMGLPVLAVTSARTDDSGTAKRFIAQSEVNLGISERDVNRIVGAGR